MKRQPLFTRGELPLYERDPVGFQKTIAALDKERETLSALEEEWLELEMLREELEG